MSDTAITRRLDQMLRQFHELESKLADPQVLCEHQKVAEISRQRAALEPVVAQYRAYKNTLAEAQGVRQLLAQETEADLRAMAEQELPPLEQKARDLLEQIKGDLVTTEDRQIGSVILEVRAGVGGDEAAIWAGDLLGMYERYAVEKGWKWEPIEFSPSEMGGCKSAMACIRGEGVWMHLGYEGGTHCVKRVPATEAQGRVHTSTATAAILPEPREVDVQIPESDVKMDITTARGPGGQNVNKVATAVKMFHIPTGIEVRIQETKSQQQNRQLAWQVLRARVHEHYQRQAQAQRTEARNKMIGSGDRSERIRTYRWKENIAVDHRINASFNLARIMDGHLDEVIHALIEHDKAQRLAAL